MARRWEPPATAITMAADLMVQGFDGEQIAQVLAEKTDLRLDDRRRGLLLEAAKVVIRERARACDGVEHEAAIGRLQHLYRKALTAGEYRAALEVHRDLQRLEASAAATEPETTTEPAAPFSFDARYRQSMADGRSA